VPTTSPEAGTSAPPPSATIGETPSATPATARIPEISWSERGFEGQVHAVAVDGAQLVAVGATADGPTAWTSPDGVTWEPHGVPQPNYLDEYREGQHYDYPGEDPRLYLNLASMGPLARLGDTLFSFGTFAGDNDYYRPLGWHSADGTEWEFIDSKNAFFQCCFLKDLETGDPGLLAVQHNFGEYGGEMWLWTPETSWELTWPRVTMEPDTTPWAEILDAEWADGKFVTVGMAAELEPAVEPKDWSTWASSWVSTDGRSWQAAPPSEDLEGSIMHAVSPLPGGGFVAVGCERCVLGGLGTPAAWMSLDGLTWTPVALPGDFEGAAYGVLQLGSGLLAVGAASNGTATWTSADGVSWRAGPVLAGAADASFHNIAVWQDEVVLFLYRDREFGVAHDSVLLRGVVEP
jgi:hypothetical protein